MKCLGAGSDGNDFAEDGSGEPSTKSGSPSAEDEVIRRVTKSRGAVGPGNCADR